MPEPSEQASQRQRRANRVGIRTLRQRPKLIGVLADGEPLYEVRSVRLVLRGQTPHFNRLVACDRCGQDQAGAPVLSPADLDAPLRPMICADCVQRAGVSSVWEPEATRPPAERVAPPAADAPTSPEPAPAVPGAGGEGLEPLERRLEAVGARVEELGRLAQAQHAADAERSRAEEATLAALRGAMSQALAGARAEIAAVSDESAARLADVEASLRQSLAGLTQVLDAQRVNLTTVVGEVTEACSEMHRAVVATQELAEAQGRLEQRVAETAGLGTSPSGADVSTIQAVVDQRLHELAAQVAQGTARMDALLRAHEESTSRLAGLEKRLDLLAGQLVGERREPERRTAVDRRPGVQLLESLEVQLQGASDRLAARSAGRGAERPGPAGDAGWS